MPLLLAGDGDDKFVASWLAVDTGTEVWLDELVLVSFANEMTVGPFPVLDVGLPNCVPVCVDERIVILPVNSMPQLITVLLDCIRSLTRTNLKNKSISGDLVFG
jgi:hypothetical protein